MIILSLRTDKPEAELGLYENDKRLDYVIWSAHRQLAETLHHKITELLNSQNKKWDEVEAIVMYEGPGSFTGLRIGLSVGNAIAYSNNILAVGSSGEDWLNTGIEKILKGNAQKESVMPVYGSEANITTPRK